MVTLAFKDRILNILMILGLCTVSDCAVSMPIDLACYWKPPATEASGIGSEAARFYTKIYEPAYFSLDMEKSLVKNSDSSKVQDIVFRNMYLSQYGDEAEINISSLNIKGLKDIPASLIIRIDPYSLRSIMMLTLFNTTTKTRESLWLREGQCNLRKF